jgi:hypothetical protein
MSSDKKTWWVDREYLDRNLVVVKVDDSVRLFEKDSPTEEASRIIHEVKSSLFVEDFFAGVYNPKNPNELYFQYPTQKILKTGSVVRIAVPASMLHTKRDFVTIKRNIDGTVLIIP